MKEIWKDIHYIDCVSMKEIDYRELYQVSNFGRVKNIKHKKEHFLKNEITSDGYLRVTLSKNGKAKHYFVHRIVAHMFIPNIENKPQVNHINEFEKQNNRVDNLCWMTSKENNNYGTHVERSAKNQRGSKNKKSIKVICITTGDIYESSREAERNTSAYHNDIIKCCKGKRNLSGKSEEGEPLKWMFYDEYLKLIKEGD